MAIGRVQGHVCAYVCRRECPGARPRTRMCKRSVLKHVGVWMRANVHTFVSGHRTCVRGGRGSRRRAELTSGSFCPRSWPTGSPRKSELQGPLLAASQKLAHGARGAW